MIYILLIMEICLLLFAFKISNNDILEPCVIVCLVWIFSTLSAVYNISYWNINLRENTVLLITSGLFTFILANTLSKHVRFVIGEKNYSIASHESVGGVNYINFSNVGLCVALLISIITLYFQFRYVMSTIGGIGTWSEIMFNYRSNNSTYSILTDENTKPSFLSNLESVLKVFAYMLSYIGVNNYVAGESSVTRKIVYFVPGFAFAVDRLMNAGRGDILLYIAALVVVIYTSIQRKCGWTKRVSRKFIKYLVISFVVVLFLFSYLATFVGRITDAGILEYITHYAGGPIENFDLFLNNDTIRNTDVFGKETFHTLLNVLGRKLNISKWVYVPHLEFRYSGSVSLGNVYGSFRYYIADFGYFGMYILTFITGWFYGKLYNIVQYRTTMRHDNFDWLLLIYMYLAPSLFMHSIAEYTFPLLTNVIASIRLLLFVWIFKVLFIDKMVVSTKIRI